MENVLIQKIVITVVLGWFFYGLYDFWKRGK